MKSKPNTNLVTCPEGLTCLDAAGLQSLTRWLNETLRWMDQVEIACSEKEPKP